MNRLFPSRVFDDGDIPLFLALGLGITALLSELNFRLLETPLRRKGVSIARQLTIRWREDQPALNSLVGSRSD
jgi:hypothetical protein